MAKSLSNPTQKRQRIISSLINSGKIRSQADVIRELKAQGLEVTQATASRDLRELGAMRGKGGDGQSRYILDGSRGVFSGNDLVLSIASSANTVVVRTSPAAAQFIASALDSAIQSRELSTAIGTIAGDDTVLIISLSNNGGAALAKRISIMFGKGK